MARVAREGARGAALGRLGALLEVLLVLAAAHTAFRAFGKLTSWGRAEYEAGVAFSPGAILAATGLGMILLRRRSADESGLSLAAVPRALPAGFVALAVVSATGALLLLAGAETRPADLGLGGGAILLLAGLAATSATLVLLQRGTGRLDRIPPASWTLLLAAILAGGIIAAAVARKPLGPELAAIGWRFVCAGIGEEIFFRGYLQSRLDRAFGRPWRLIGTSFGPGVVIASALFGLVHALNPFDTFRGSGTLAWGHALAATGMPYGFLRARTGSVAAPALLHGLLDVFAHWIHGDAPR